MVSSGVPNELPEEVTAKAVRREARQDQRDLVVRLGQRLGIAELSERTSSSRLTPEGSINEASKLLSAEEGSRRRKEFLESEKSVRRARPIERPPIGVPGVKFR